MAICDVCKNEYQNSFEIILKNKTYTFDSFECAIYKLAPSCTHCNCKIIGHGIEAKEIYYCCAHCARQAGINSVKDHA